MTTRLSDDGRILHIHIPMRLQRRGGRKVIITPPGPPSSPPALPVSEDPVVRALVKAKRWQNMLEDGTVATIRDLAAKEGVDRSYIARHLRLNALAPDIVETVLRGDYPEAITLETLRGGIPVDWEEQRELFGVFQ